VIRLLGDTSVVLAFVLAVVGVYATLFGVRRQPRYVRVGEGIAYINFGLLTVANLAMVYALATHDFSISYVAQVGSRSTPLFFSIISLWGALEGSLLLWGWVLAAVTVIALRTAPRDIGPMRPYALATLLAIGAFFYLLLTNVASPFQAVWPVPLDGPGPNPLLQNHWLMAIHPPLTYLGYVGMSVPFAFAIGSLLAGRTDQAWIEVSRRYTLWSWLALSLAIVAGMWWAYEVLGWGGYWAWDPVENASLMPWLTSTAFLHSLMVERRRGMLKVWNLSLIIATFLLTILGTFLTRSGILSSVHAFAGGEIGYYFLGFLGVTLVFSLVLLAGRSEALHTEGRLDGVASRETVFLVNNLVLVGLTLTVLIGTLFPLVAEAVRGVKVSVGAPFFNQMTLPFATALLFLVGVGPMLPWGAARPGGWLRRMAWPVGSLVLASVAVVALGAPSPYTVLAFGFAAFGLASNIQEIGRPVRARIRTHGERAVVALGRVIGSNQHRYGGYIAHVGFIVIAVGIAASSSYRTVQEATLGMGESVEIEGYELRLTQLWSTEGPRRVAVGADLALSRAGRPLGVMEPRINYYRSQTNPIPTAAVRTRLVDVYVTLMAYEPDGSSATVRAAVEPLVGWIWGGSLILAVGALIAVWPRRQRRIRRIEPRTGDTRTKRPPAKRRPRTLARGSR
jgi:cytochrome c-type biogenesis protein CcmF